MELILKEKDPNTRILIALVLFKVGDPEGLQLVDRLSFEDPNTRVRKMYKAIYNEFLVGELGEFASTLPEVK